MKRQTPFSLLIFFASFIAIGQLEGTSSFRAGRVVGRAWAKKKLQEKISLPSIAKKISSPEKRKILFEQYGEQPLKLYFKQPFQEHVQKPFKEHVQKPFQTHIQQPTAQAFRSTGQAARSLWQRQIIDRIARLKNCMKGNCTKTQALKAAKDVAILATLLWGTATAVEKTGEGIQKIADALFEHAENRYDKTYEVEVKDGLETISKFIVLEDPTYKFITDVEGAITYPMTGIGAIMEYGGKAAKAPVDIPAKMLYRALPPQAKELPKKLLSSVIAFMPGDKVLVKSKGLGYEEDAHIVHSYNPVTDKIWVKKSETDEPFELYINQVIKISRE